MLSKTLVVFGSGGHTAEMLRMTGRMGSVELAIACPDDVLAARAHCKALVTVPRPRRVHQELLSSLISIIIALFHVTMALLSLRKRHPYRIVLCNGPAVAVVVALADRIAALLSCSPRAKLVYVESFARVRSLSMSGRTMRVLADRVLVQWPSLAAPPRLFLSACEYHGLLV